MRPRSEGGADSVSIARARSPAMLAITCGSWIDLAMWSMKATRTTTSSRTRIIVAVIETWGTNSPCEPGPIETRVRIAKTNVAT